MPQKILHNKLQLETQKVLTYYKQNIYAGNSLYCRE